MQGVLLAERFRISERVGSGGMGEVWSAQDERMRRKVAVKLVQTLRLDESETQARFQREVQLAGRLSHQNIVTVHDWGEELVGGRRTLYVVMELVPGVSLHRRLAETEPPPWPVAVGWAGQIAQALHIAHGRGVIHRDIKPANVILTPDGLIKVLDFGVAKFMGDTMSVHGLTVAGALIGSPPYMSPEQAEGDREVDHRSDLYSLGCLLHHAVIGEPPFTATNPLAVLRMQADKTPVAPIDRNPALPRPLSDLIMNLLAKRPEDRPADAAAVHAALSTLLVDHVVTLPDESPLDLLQPGHTDPLAGGILERAWQIWRSTVRYSADRREEADRWRDEAVAEAEKIRAEARKAAVQLIEEAAETAEELLVRAKADADEPRRAEDSLRPSREEAVRLAGDEYLAEAQAKAEEIVTVANSEASKLRMAAVRRAETLLREVDDKRLTMIREAEDIKAEAVQEARRTVEEGTRELEKVLRRREEVKVEIDRVQDVLEALESYERPAAPQDE
ncbi:protein kinase [Streptomyces sp. NPDC004610]|uniref:serine/threonine-protein kinase n=1 Tax=unclassified Streptomyces TaxID=2593676 RepID=UPI0033B98390